MDEFDILEAVRQMWWLDIPKFIVLTGGEPTIHDLSFLLLHLKTQEPECFIAMETNCTSTNPVAYKKQGWLDWITGSPKMGTDVCQEVLEETDEVKIVYTKNAGPFTFVSEKLLKAGRAFIQPCSEDFGPAVRFVMNHPQWRLSVQVQKVIGVR